MTIAARQRGFSLIEVLVTMLILSFGLLGVAGLLVKGVSNAASSESYSKASQLAAEMADRMRANPAVALSASSAYLLNTGNATAPNLWTDAVPTTASSIALKDKQDWMNALAAQLPQGRGRITNSVGGGARQVDIEVAWSNCFGTLSDSDKTSCTDNSAAAFRVVKFELRL
jgi:type IV pilus assembly protein PilV